MTDDEFERMLHDDAGVPAPSIARAAATRNMLVASITGEPAARRRRVRTRFAVWGGIGVLALGALGTGAAVVMQPKSVTENYVVDCFASAQRGPNGQFNFRAAALADAAGPQRITDAIAVCKQVWETGSLNPGVNPTKASAAPGAAPEKLAACVMPDGTAAVVPGDDQVCEAIGLSPMAG